jgi:hypothetical protein
VSLDTKSVQPQCEVYQDLFIWVFEPRPYLARRNQKVRSPPKNDAFGNWYLKIIEI